MDLTEAISTQRAIRRLKPDPVDDDVIKRCLQLAIHAPSGGNRQGWEWIVVKDPEVKAALARQYRMVWKIYGGLGRLLYGGDEKQRRTLDAVQWQVDHFEQIPALVVPCLRGIALPIPSIVRTSRYGSIYPAIQNFLLAARVEGLGAALVTLPLWSRIVAHRILNLPPTVEPIAVIPIGWPKGRYGPNTRRSLEKVLHFDRYGNKESETHRPKP